MNRNPSMAGIASLVQSRGRDGDTMLVHMAPEEVKGLQSLALAAGGSLSINPDTGLYEANFLKKLLPTLLGFGLNFLFPGLGALGSGLLVGAGETIRTGGDLGKGLMAGLGAFGGAGLGSALAGAGAVAGGAGQAGITAAGEAAAAEAAKQGAQQAAIEAAKKKAIEEATKKAVAEQAAQKGIASGAAGWQNIKAGAGSLFNTSPGIGALGGADAFGATFNALPGGMIGKAGLVTSAANVLTPDMEVPGGGYDIDDSYYESYGYSPEQGRFLGGQWRKGYPGFPGYAAGGSVMPRTNYDFPQAGITKSSYAPNIDYTRPQEVLDGYEVKLDPFTGEERFASGGEVGVGALVPPPPIIDPGPQQGMFPPPPPIIDPGPQEPLPTTPLPEEPVYATAAPYTGPMVAEEYDSAPQFRYDFAPAPQQSLEQYYQSLLTPPQQQQYDPSFMNYMQSFNNFVTSPVAPPPPPPQPPQTPPSKPPGDERVTGTGGTGTGMRYDPELGRFVPGTGSPGDTGIDFSELQNLVNSGMFSGFNFGELGNYLNSGGYGDTSGLSWDPATGSFRQPGSQTINTPPGSTDENSLNMNQVQFNPNQFQFDPNAYQFNPFVDGFDMSSLPGYGQDQTMSQGNLTGIDQFADPSYNQPFQYDFSGLGQMGDMNAMSGMGDMGGYGTQFQGFQPLSTDFGSTYQAPAMNLPTFDASAYAPQQMDFGSMGYGLGSLPSIASTYQPQAVATPTFDMSSFQMPASQSPMMTGGDTGMSNMSTAPQFGFGNSDVLYGQSNFGQGGEQNIFGFAGGGAIQKAAAGKLVTGDGDGMSDDIRANINGNQEARLADGEFVIPADVVSHLGNGSTDAGADRLYSMMDRIRKARTGKTRQAPEIDAEKYLPA